MANIVVLAIALSHFYWWQYFAFNDNYYSIFKLIFYLTVFLYDLN